MKFFRSDGQSSVEVSRKRKLPYEDWQQSNFSQVTWLSQVDPEIREISEHLGLQNRVSLLCHDDIYIKNYFDYEKGVGKPIMKDRLKSAVNYWRNVVKAPESIISIIESGVCIDFLTIPPLMHFANNKSALMEHEFVSEAVQDLLDLKLIEICENKPHVVSPLSVAINGDKKRLILDLSILNEYVRYEKFKLEDHRDFFQMARLCDYVASFDIKSCYHQISVNERYTTYLGFEWTLNGKTTFYKFLVLPFGLASAPRICKNVFRPLVRKWRENGIILVLFYDDCIFGMNTLNDCMQASNVIFNDLMNCHICPNPEKSCFKPSKIVDWLGYQWNFNTRTVKVTELRIQRLKDRLCYLKEILPIVTPRKVALVVGSLVSMILVLKDEAVFNSRFLHNVINFREWEELGWNTRINLNHLDFGMKVLEEIEFWEKNIDSLNFRMFEHEVSGHKLLFGDAGEKAVGGFLIEDKIRLPFHVKLPENLIGKSSTEREIFALHKGLESYVDKLNGCRVVYLTDNQSCEIISRKGSSKLWLHQMMFDIRKFLKQNDILLTVAWINRNHNFEADYMSKVEDPDDWSISCKLFDKIKILSGFIFTIDLFANESNSKCCRFYSKYMCPKTSGVNAFNFSWKDEICYLCPPPSLGLEALLYLKFCQSKGVLIIPSWKSSPIWPVLKNEKIAKFCNNKWSFPASYLDFKNSRSKFAENFKGTLEIFKFDFTQV